MKVIKNLILDLCNFLKKFYISHVNNNVWYYSLWRNSSSNNFYNYCCNNFML